MSVRIISNNIQIDRVGNNFEAIISTHGGYTPKRGPLKKGSGKTQVPGDINRELKVLFYSPADTVCIGMAAQWMFQGFPSTQPVQETSAINDIVENYSLTHFENSKNWVVPDTSKYDLIRVLEGKKIHLSDVWEVIRVNALHYHTIHFFACRINKLAYTDQII